MKGVWRKIILSLVGIIAAGWSVADNVAPPAIQSFPPVVTRVSPASGSTGVDPNLTDITIEFSQPIRSKSWSLAPAFDIPLPNFIGKPNFSPDGRMCVLKARLSTNSTYAFWLNTSEHHNFIGENGLPLSPYLVYFQTAMFTEKEKLADALAAGKAWMAKYDKQLFDECWDISAPGLRKAHPKTDWVNQAKIVYETLGAPQSRSPVSRDLRSAGQGGDESEFLVFVIQTRFAKANEAVETIIIQNMGPRQWAVRDYSVKYSSSQPPRRVQAPTTGRQPATKQRARSSSRRAQTPATKRSRSSNSYYYGR